jgi:hypothetical protein
MKRPSPSRLLHIAAALLCMAAVTAEAHIQYTGRNFGALQVSSSLTISSSAAYGFGWARGITARFGDSHALIPFRFTLTNPATIMITVTGTGSTPLTRPAFSVYKGLDLSGTAHDASAASYFYMNDVFGDGKWDGCFNALADWTIGNESDEYTTLFYQGHAADGSSVNFGTAATVIPTTYPGYSVTNAPVAGDGNADGTVTKAFSLSPGDYSIFVGGAQANASNRASTLGFSITLQIGATPIQVPVLPISGITMQRPPASASPSFLP